MQFFSFFSQFISNLLLGTKNFQILLSPTVRKFATKKKKKKKFVKKYKTKKKILKIFFPPK